MLSECCSAKLRVLPRLRSNQCFLVRYINTNNNIMKYQKIRFRSLNSNINFASLNYFSSSASKTSNSSSIPGYSKPLPIDIKTGDIKRDFSASERFSWAKRNKEFRKHLVYHRRHIANELLFGSAANRMINKLQKGGNQKKLQHILINHLYALKINKMRLPFTQLEEEEKKMYDEKKVDDKSTAPTKKFEKQKQLRISKAPYKKKKVLRKKE